MLDFFNKDKYFYNGSIRRYTIIFGSIFNDMWIQRKAENKSQMIKIPFRYGPGNAYEKIAQDVESREENKIRMVVPALSYEFTGLEVDENRKENRNIKITRNVMNTDESYNAQFNRVPYNFRFSLYAITKNIDDMLQIVEQIVPTFNPNVCIKMKDVDNTFIDVEQNINIHLESIDAQDNWEEPEASRYVEYTFNFVVKGFLYGRTVPVQTIGEIEIRSIIEDEVMSQMNITDHFDKPYLESVKINSEHYKIMEYEVPATANSLPKKKTRRMSNKNN